MYLLINYITTVRIQKVRLQQVRRFTPATIIKMQKQSDNQNFLKKKTIGYLGGPILFTAPHSKRLNRGGPKYGQQIRIHEKQIYTSWIAAELSTLTSLKKNQPNSFVVWGKSAVIDQKDLDPNYLLQSMLAQSPFHQSLHAWALKHEKVPILHVDIHGKLNRKNDCEIDVGIRAMEVHWENDPLLLTFKQYFQGKFSKIFAGMKFKQFDCVFNTDPYLHGYWGGKMMTMTEQAILLGIPSFQLEIPRQVRKTLFSNPQLMASFADGIKQFYTKIICPYYEKKTKPLKLSKQIASKFEPCIKNQKDVELAKTQLADMQRKLQLNVNAKKI